MTLRPVFVGRAKDGSARLVPAEELAGRLHGRGWIPPEKLQELYEIPDEIWPTVQGEIAKAYREIVHPDPSEAELHRRVNQKLCRYALMFPPYGRPGDLSKINRILQSEPVRLGEIGAEMHDLVMRPATRARMLTGLYMKIPLFAEFAHVIDASYFAYTRGNFVAALFTIIPVVEGLLLRWRGHNSSSLEAPAMADAARWVRETPKRTPLLTRPLFADSWAESCSYILQHHFYKKTQAGQSYDNFNRHLALHMLEDVPVYSPDNLMRVYLLLDTLTQLYLCEHWEPVSLMNLRDEEEEPHARAYLRAFREQIEGVGNRPEEILWTHARSNPTLLVKDKYK